jgi:hypothetical protein
MEPIHILQLSAYKTISTPRDVATINETPNFIRLVLVLIKIDNTNITFIESGAVAIAGITTDFDNEVKRNTVLPH